MMMVAVVIFAHEFKPPRAVAEVEPFDDPHFFQQMHGAIDGRQIAFSIAFAHFSKNFTVCERMRMFSKDFQDCRARAGDFAGLAAQPAFQD